MKALTIIERRHFKGGGAKLERAHTKSRGGANLKGWPTSKSKRLPYLEAHTCKGPMFFRGVLAHYRGGATYEDSTNL